jgi:hypothetical protein
MDTDKELERGSVSRRTLVMQKLSIAIVMAFLLPRFLRVADPRSFGSVAAHPRESVFIGQVSLVVGQGSVISSRSVW